MINWIHPCKNLGVLLLFAMVITACAGEPPTQTIEGNQPITDSGLAQTQTGFYWPTGTIPAPEDNWLGSGCDGNTSYYKGEYHIGRDIPASVGDPVYAIADGNVLWVSPNGWGQGNVALLVLHKLDNGEPFVAVYGHIRTSLEKGDTVQGGRPIATIGTWQQGAHLHFGVRPDASIEGPYGKMPCPFSGDTNGFVDPVGWVTANSPAQEGIVSSTEMEKQNQDNLADLRPGLVIPNDQGVDEEGNKNQILEVQLSNDKSTLSIVWDNGLLRNYEVGSFALKSEIRSSDYGTPNGFPSISHVSLAPDGEQVATGGFQLAIWEVDTGKLVRKYLPEEVDGLAAWPEYPDRSRVEEVAWSPDGETIAFDDLRGRILFLDVKSGKLKTYPWSNDPECNLNHNELHCDLTDLVWSPDSKYVVASWGKENNSDYVWEIIDVETFDIAGEFVTCPFDCFSWSPDSRFIAFRNLDVQRGNQIDLFDVSSHKVSNTITAGVGGVEFEFISKDKLICYGGTWELDSNGLPVDKPNWEIWDMHGKFVESFDIDLASYSSEFLYLGEDWLLIKDPEYNFYTFHK